MIGIGAIVGIALIVIDAVLTVGKKGSLPPLAVGIGIYLPMSATFAVVVGAVVGHWYNRRAAASRAPERAVRLGTLVASGMIVGESLFGVLNAGLIVALSNDAPIALVAVISASNGDNLVPRTLSALGRAGAHILALAQSTSSYHISFMLPEAEVDTVVRTLHADLGLA
jgi:hypothetical protein